MLVMTLRNCLFVLSMFISMRSWSKSDKAEVNKVNKISTVGKFEPDGALESQQEERSRNDRGCQLGIHFRC